MGLFTSPPEPLQFISHSPFHIVKFNKHAEKCLKHKCTVVDLAGKPILLKLILRSRATKGTLPASQEHTHRSSPSNNHYSDFILLITLLFFIPLLPDCAFPDSTVQLGIFLDSYINGIIQYISCDVWLLGLTCL